MNTSKNTNGQTNFFALTLMVLFVLFLLITVTGNGSDTQALDIPDNQSGVATAAATSTSSEIDRNSFMPAGIPVDESAVVENHMISRGSGEAVQQVISFRSSLPASEIAAEYQRWMTENDYALQRVQIGSLAATLTALNGQKGMVITISHLSSLDMRYIEIINYDLTGT
jgi:hypothetical protein